MKLNYEVEKPIRMFRKHGKVIKLIEEFLDSEKEIANITEWEENYKSSNSAYGTFNVAIRRNNYPARVFRNAQKLYIERTDIDV